MSDNPNFVPMYSTNNIYRDGDDTICLEDELDNIEASIANKSNNDHTHTGYATATDVEELEALVGDTAVATQISSAIATKSDINHVHSSYAPLNHTHSNYATNAYISQIQSAVIAELANKAAINHVHDYEDFEDAPTSLPANGGDADTVGGKSASDFATAESMAALQNLVGDTAVSVQITSAIVDKYEKPATGIPKTDLATDVQTSLSKADTAIQSLAGYATEAYVNTQVANLVDSSPDALNTLNELSEALGDNPNFATTVATQIGTKVDKVDGKGLSTNDYTTAEKTKLAGIATGANKTTVDSALSTTSTNPVQNKVVNAAISNLNTLVGDTAVSAQISAAIANKVDAVSGKGLSTNDYTTTEKNKLAGIAAGANKTTVDTALSSTSTNPVQNKVINTALAGKANTSHTHNYAGSSSAGGAATSANKLNTNAGSATQPVYFANGVPVPTTYTLGKSVPANAVFTDTTALGSMTGTLPVSKGGTGATTAADARNAIGALAKNGDTMTGNLTVFTGSAPALVLRSPDNSSGDQALSRIYKNASATADYGLQLRDYAHGGNETNTSSLLMICDKQANLADKLQFVRQTNGSNAYYKLYGEHNKPTPSDIGAAASNHTHSAATTSAAGLMSAADKVKVNAISSFNLTKELSTITISGKCVKIQGLFIITVKMTTTANISQWTKLFSINSAGTLQRDDQRGCPDSGDSVKIQARNNTEAETGLWFQSATAIPAGTYYFDMILM